LGFFLRNCFGLDLFLAFLLGQCFFGFIESGLFGDNKITPTLFDLLLYNLLVSSKVLLGFCSLDLPFCWSGFYLVLDRSSCSCPGSLAISTLILLAPR
jgi:hypothetical protein